MCRRVSGGPRAGRSRKSRVGGTGTSPSTCRGVGAGVVAMLARPARVPRAGPRHAPFLRVAVDPHAAPSRSCRAGRTANNRSTPRGAGAVEAMDRRAPSEVAFHGRLRSLCQTRDSASQKRNRTRMLLHRSSLLRLLRPRDAPALTPFSSSSTSGIHGTCSFTAQWTMRRMQPGCASACPTPPQTSCAPTSRWSFGTTATKSNSVQRHP